MPMRKLVILLAKTFNSISELMKQLEYDATVSLVSEVFTEVSEVIAEHIDNDVYSYDTDGYRRYKKSGGFADPDMIQKDIRIGKDNVGIEITNDSLARGENSGEYLDSLIEYGDSYSYGSAGARPIMSNVEHELESTGLVSKIMKSSLERKGY